MITNDGRTNVGVRWEPVVFKPEGDPAVKVVYRLTKSGKKSTRTRIGTLNEADNTVRADDGRTTLGRYRSSGIYPEVAAWFYTQITEVWKLDNEFAARWASYAFTQDHRDLKVALAAFMMVQSRKGEPILDDGKVAFYDEDYRDVGEAMALSYVKESNNDLSPKHLLRIHELLTLPSIAQINRDLGFGASARNAFLGRWPKTVEKWLRYREENPKLLDGLVKAGFRRTVMELARKVNYKPTTPLFFQKLRWKQVQAKDGRRTVAIGEAVEAAVTWEGLSEAEICQKIVSEKPSWKVLTSRLPSTIGLTRAIVAAVIESEVLSNKDLIIISPTLEELGLLKVPQIKARWDAALKAANDMRAANIARNVQSQAVKDKLQEAAETAAANVVAEAVRQMRIYIIVDISASMQASIEAAKSYIATLAPTFPLDKIHVSVFNTAGKEVVIKHASKAGVENAFKGIAAGGGTEYGEGVRAIQGHKPSAEEDVVFIFIGDEEANPFDQYVRASGLNPLAFGLVKMRPESGAAGWRAATYGVDNNIAVRETARRLGIPCFMIQEDTFKDVYAVGRTIRDLIKSTPVNVAVTAQRTAAPRQTLIDQILRTELLKKPCWAEG
jgi:hypothetical protein